MFIRRRFWRFSTILRMSFLAIAMLILSMHPSIADNTSFHSLAPYEISYDDGGGSSTGISEQHRGTYTSNFPYGVISGDWVCSTTSGSVGDILSQTPSSANTINDKYCWCNITGFRRVSYTNNSSVSGSEYVLIKEFSNWDGCNQCGNECAQLNSSNNLNARENLYNAYGTDNTIPWTSNYHYIILNPAGGTSDDTSLQNRTSRTALFTNGSGLYTGYDDINFIDQLSGSNRSIKPLNTSWKKTGYTFDGFWSGPNGTGTQYVTVTTTANNDVDYRVADDALTHVSSINSNETWYAHWISNCPANATYNSTNNACECDSGYVTYTDPNTGVMECIEDKFQLGVNLTTTDFSFLLNAAGKFFVWWDNDTSNIEVIDHNALAPVQFHLTAPDAGTHTLHFGGRADRYFDSDTGSTYKNNTITFYLNNSIVSISGSIGKVFPTLIGQPQVNFTQLFSTCRSLIGPIPEELFDGVFGTPSRGMFSSIFMYCNNLTGPIPENLFSGITGTAPHMFYHTFGYCTSLGTENGESKYGIPMNLFSSIKGPPQDEMFNRTFENCSGLTGPIPPTLFAEIKGNPAYGMFVGTFKNCTGLTGSIPPNLFAEINGEPAYAMFFNTFNGCSGLTGSIPTKLFCDYENPESRIYGAPQPLMFAGTFNNCSGLSGPIPENLFSGIFGDSQRDMFDTTFAGCTNLNGKIPDNLFGQLTGSPAQDMFYRTFYNCSSLGVASTCDMNKCINDECSCIQKATSVSTTCSINQCIELNRTNSIPTNLFNGISGKAATNMFTETFRGCTNIDGFYDDNNTPNDTNDDVYTEFIPTNYMEAIDHSENSPYSVGSMNRMFTGTNILDACPVDMYQYSLFYQADVNPKVSCQPCPQPNNNGFYTTTRGQTGNADGTGATLVSQCAPIVPIILDLDLKPDETLNVTSELTNEIYAVKNLDVFSDDKAENVLTAVSVPGITTSRQGYDFNGFYPTRQQEFSFNTILSTDNIYIGQLGRLTNTGRDAGKTYTTSQTWYAHWINNILGVTLAKNYGSYKPNTGPEIYTIYDIGVFIEQSDDKKMTVATPTEDATNCVTIPEREGYNFLGYFSTSGDEENTEQYIDANGCLTIYGDTAAKGKTYTPSWLWYAHWEPEEHIITLENYYQSDTDNAEIYTVYDSGAYLDGERTDFMDSENNPINNPEPEDCIDDNGVQFCRFAGYFQDEFNPDPNDYVQYIADSGYINSDGTNIAARATDDSTTWYAQYDYKCAGGYYLKSDTRECTECPSGYYCPGFEWTRYVGEDIGLIECPSEYPYSATQSSDESQCYTTENIACADVNPYSDAHGTANYANESGTCKVYSDGGTECEFTNDGGCDITELVCDDGYTDLTVGTYMSNNITKMTDDRPECALSETNNCADQAPGEWAINFNESADIKKVTGHVSCNTIPGDNSSVESRIASNSLFVNTEDGPYCWLQATAVDDTTVNPAYVYIKQFDSYEECADKCGFEEYIGDERDDIYRAGAATLNTHMCVSTTCESGYEWDNITNTCTPITYTITLYPSNDSDDGAHFNDDASTHEISVIYGEVVQNLDDADKPIRDSYRFNGFSDENDTQYFDEYGNFVLACDNDLDNGTWCIADDVVLYGQWTQCAYSGQYVDEQNQCTCPDDTIEDAEYNKCREECEIGQHYNGEACVWDSATIQYVFNNEINGATETAPIPYDYDPAHDGYYAETLLAFDDDAVPGYSFDGWYTDDDTFENQVYDEYVFDEDTILYAHWEPNTYDITFNSNGGTIPDGGTTSATATYDAALPTIETGDDGDLLPQRDGYEFIGYYDDANDTLYYDADGTAVVEVWQNTDDIELYAHWEPIEYTITFETDGGTPVAPIQYTVEYGADVSQYESEKDYYRFNGWLDEDDIPVESIEPGTFGDMTLYAYWTPEDYTITFNSNGGTPIDDITYTAEDEDIDVTNDEYTPERTNYDFLGWYDACDDGNEVETVYTSDPQNIELCAHWKLQAFKCDSNMWLHVGDDKACLSETKPNTELVMKFMVGETPYYLGVSKDDYNLHYKYENNDGSNIYTKMHIVYGTDPDNTYNVYDESGPYYEQNKEQQLKP